jgi:hypothetical protein
MDGRGTDGEAGRLGLRLRFDGGGLDGGGLDGGGGDRLGGPRRRDRHIGPRA